MYGKQHTRLHTQIYMHTTPQIQTQSHPKRYYNLKLILTNLSLYHSALNDDKKTEERNFVF